VVRGHCHGLRRARRCRPAPRPHRAYWETRTNRGLALEGLSSRILSSGTLMIIRPPPWSIHRITDEDLYSHVTSNALIGLRHCAEAVLRSEDEDLGLEQGVGLVKCSSELSLAARSVPRREVQDYPT
jgi:hypothetical protein